MEFWETTPYSKWYKSHRKFSFTAHHLIELYDEKQQIPDSIFKPFLKSVFCHSKGEEKLFQSSLEKEKILDEHSKIQPSKQYSHEEKYLFCKSLLQHMKEEEAILSNTWLLHRESASHV